MRNHKNEDREYLKQFKGKSFDEVLTILSTEATKLTDLVKGMLKRGKDSKNGKN